MTNYVLEGPRWGGGASGTSGGTVTWAVDSTVPAGFVTALSAAFADWTSRANIAFTQLGSTSGAQITFSDTYIDGIDKVLGETTYRYTGQSFVSAAVNFDSGEGWHGTGTKIVSNDSVSLFIVAVHEIGHAIGLDHYNAGPAVMNATLDRTITDLTASDIAGIQALYGAPVAPSVSPVPSPVPSSVASLFGTTQYNAGGPAGTVYGLYKGLLGHAPDALGLEAGVAALANGATPAGVAATILASPDYAARNPSPVSDSAYVTGLYTTLLNRAPDAQGQAFFQNELNAGISRATVAGQIATSAEAQSVLQPTFAAGVVVPDAVSAQVARLYYGVLGRTPDSGGLLYFQNFAKSVGVGGVAQTMLSSLEFGATHGNLSDPAFIDSLYVGALGHHADAAAVSYWGGQLAAGAGRVQVAVQIAQSQEAQVHLVGVIEQGMAVA